MGIKQLISKYNFLTQKIDKSDIEVELYEKIKLILLKNYKVSYKLVDEYSNEIMICSNHEEALLNQFFQEDEKFPIHILLEIY
jgi:hypothetical protein